MATDCEVGEDGEVKKEKRIVKEVVKKTVKKKVLCLCIFCGVFFSQMVLSIHCFIFQFHFSHFFPLKRIKGKISVAF